MLFSTAISARVRSGTTRSAAYRVSGARPNVARVACSAEVQNRPISWLVRSFRPASARRLSSNAAAGQEGTTTSRCQASSSSSSVAPGRYSRRTLSQ